MPAPSLRQRFEVGASLLPPVALGWLAARAGWLSVPPGWLLAAMPAVLAIGMGFPGPFMGWHQGVRRVQAWIGRHLLAALLGLVFLLVLLPIGWLLRLRGRSFLEAPSGDSFWTPSRPPGSLRDPF